MSAQLLRAGPGLVLAPETAIPLLPSQLATLEPPHPDENALAADIGQPPDALVQGLVEQLQESAA